MAGKQSFVSEDQKYLTECNYASNFAFFNLGGIVDGESGNAAQEYTMSSFRGNYTFNFCKQEIQSPQLCAAKNSYGFFESAHEESCLNLNTSAVASDIMQRN